MPETLPSAQHGDNAGKRPVAVVTGASRGLGIGIARALGANGYVVYVSGRSEEALSGAARQVSDRGGIGIAVTCDHRDDAAVSALFERVADEAGGLDILVNNAAAVHPVALTMPGPFWQKPLCLVDMIDVGLRSAYVSSYYAAPIMARQRRGLIANISFYGAVSYFHGPAYGAAKAGTDKMSFDMAADLRSAGIAAVSIWPGFIRTDALASRDPETLSPMLRGLLPQFETPEFTGLVIAALARDPELMALSGATLVVAELGKRYGIKDLDGKQPVSYREEAGGPASFAFSKLAMAGTPR